MNFALVSLVEERCSHLPSLKHSQSGNNDCQAGGYRPKQKEDEENDSYVYWVIHGTTVEIFEVTLTKKPLKNLHTIFQHEEAIVPHVGFAETDFQTLDMFVMFTSGKLIKYTFPHPYTNHEGTVISIDNCLSRQFQLSKAGAEIIQFEVLSPNSLITQTEHRIFHTTINPNGSVVERALSKDTSLWTYVSDFWSSSPSILCMRHHKRLVITVDAQSELSIYRVDQDVRIQSGNLIDANEMKQLGAFDQARFALRDNSTSLATFKLTLFVFLSNTEKGVYKLFPIEMDVDGNDITIDSQNCLHDTIRDIKESINEEMEGDPVWSRLVDSVYCSGDHLWATYFDANEKKYELYMLNLEHYKLGWQKIMTPAYVHFQRQPHMTSSEISDMYR